jgi:hypothetical protein
MIKNHLIFTFRSFLRHKSHTLINLLGLAIGMARCTLIMLYVKDEWGYDAFHEKQDRIYRFGLPACTERVCLSRRQRLSFKGTGSKWAPAQCYVREMRSPYALSWRRRHLYQNMRLPYVACGYVSLSVTQMGSGSLLSEFPASGLQRGRHSDTQRGWYSRRSSCTNNVDRWCNKEELDKRRGNTQIISQRQQDRRS